MAICLEGVTHEAALERQIEQAKSSYMPSIVRHEDDGSRTDMTLLTVEAVSKMQAEINRLQAELCDTKTKLMAKGKLAGMMVVRRDRGTDFNRGPEAEPESVKVIRGTCTFRTIESSGTKTALVDVPEASPRVRVCCSGDWAEDHE